MPNRETFDPYPHHHHHHSRPHNAASESETVLSALSLYPPWLFRAAAALGSPAAEASGAGGLHAAGLGEAGADADAGAGGAARPAAFRLEPLLRRCLGGPFLRAASLSSAVSDRGAHAACGSAAATCTAAAASASGAPRLLPDRVVVAGPLGLAPQSTGAALLETGTCADCLSLYCACCAQPVRAGDPALQRRLERALWGPDIDLARGLDPAPALADAEAYAAHAR